MNTKPDQEMQPQPEIQGAPNRSRSQNPPPGAAPAAAPCGARNRFPTRSGASGRAGRPSQFATDGRDGTPCRPRRLNRVLMAHLPSLCRLALFALALLLWTAGSYAASSVTGVTAVQQAGTKLVNIYYDLTSDAPPLRVSVQVSNDGGASYGVGASSFTGDVGAGVQPGMRKHIVWNAGADWNERVSAGIRFRVVATDSAPPPPPPADVSGPTLNITSPGNGATVSSGSVMVSGNASDSGLGNSGIASVTVNGVAASGGSASGSGVANWSASVPLVLGLNAITVIATDGSNNATQHSISVTYSAAPPVVPGSFALIASGSFAMGDALGDGDSYELPVHTVGVSAFYMETTLVTESQWSGVQAWGASHGYTDLALGSGADGRGNNKGASYPVVDVSWYSVVKWCNARSEQAGLTPCYTVSGSAYRTGTSDAAVCDMSASGYRLPTEAEWEKAARGGLSGKRFPWGDTIDRSRANYEVYQVSGTNYYPYDLGTPGGYDPAYATGNYPYTSPVGAFPANGYGLYDMAGNVWEWCWDWDGGYGSGALSDPAGPASPASGSYRVLRGGYWYSRANNCRVSYRYSAIPAERLVSLNGFRCVHR